MLKPFYSLFLLLCLACGNPSPKEAPEDQEQTVQAPERIPIYSTIQDSNITNTSGKQIDVLYNNTDLFQGNFKSKPHRFHTDCMGIASITPWQEGLLIGKQLYIKSEEVSYFENRQEVPEGSYEVKKTSLWREQTDLPFQTEQCSGSINFLETNCNDSNLENVKLNFDSGSISIDSLLNVAFFEYDLNQDGKQESFIMTHQCCTHSLAILRID